MTDPQIIDEVERLPKGEYAIVELVGHKSPLVGRLSENKAYRFGTGMLAIEVLFNGILLPAVYQSIASIDRLTPCLPEVAWSRQPTHTYQLPPTIAAIVPSGFRPEDEPITASELEEFDDDDHELA